MRNVLKLLFGTIMILLLNTSTWATSLEGPSICACYAIVDACTGEQIDLDGDVRFSCEIANQDPPYIYSYSWPIVEGQICTGGLPPDCDYSICLDADNWEVCSIQGCTISVYQTVPGFIRINGDLMGSGYAIPTSASTTCQRIYNDELNQSIFPNILQLCEGQGLSLELGKFYIPSTSGMCLEVVLKDLFGNIFGQDQFSSGDFAGNTVDISNVFVNAQNGQTYALEMTSICCGASSPCPVNAKKILYVKVLKGSFDYVAQATSGFDPNVYTFTPVTSPPSTQLLGGQPVGNSVVNQLSFTGLNVFNPNGIAPTWSFWNVDCEGNALPTLISDGIVGFTFNYFGIGPFLIISTDQCECFRLDLEYYDACINEDVVDSYYFKEGANCDETYFKKETGKINSKELTFYSSVSPNPTQGNAIFHFSKDLMDQNIDLIILDQRGRVVDQHTFIGTHQEEIDISKFAPGMYLYRGVSGGQTFTGKFIVN